MFELTIDRQALLTPLLTVAGAVDKKQSLAILGNILLKAHQNDLVLTATDLEIEITARITAQVIQHQNSITLPAKKMVDIIRSLDENGNLTIACDGKNACVQQGRSKFKLLSLPSDHFPNSEDEVSEIEFSLPRSALIHLLQSTHFSMSHQDVRVFLNGLLLEIDGQMITTVATDGHRMSICRFPMQLNDQHQRLLIPRKGVQELLRLLNNIEDEQIIISSGKSHIKFTCSQYIFISKLIEARFPPYNKAIPRNQDKIVHVDCDLLKRALTRISILAHEKSRAVMLHIQNGQITLIANNQEQEEATETIEAQTQGDELKIGINGSYLLDVLNFFGNGSVQLSFLDMESSILVEAQSKEHYQYIIMPMKI